MALRYQDYISLQGQSFPGAEDLLARLEKAGYQLYGATNGVTAIQEGRLAHSTIASYFKEVFISEQLQSSHWAIKLTELQPSIFFSSAMV